MIVVKSAEEIAIMRQCGRILMAVLDRLRAEVKVGIKTCRLDTLVVEETKKGGVNPPSRIIAVFLPIYVFPSMTK